jgi:hypothetical protein
VRCHVFGHKHGDRFGYRAALTVRYDPKELKRAAEAGDWHRARGYLTSFDRRYRSGNG